MQLPDDVTEHLTRLLTGTQATIEQPPDEVPDEPRWEGVQKKILVNAYERDPKARAACLKRRGDRCVVCSQRMSELYGPTANGLIHVHHLKPLSQSKGKRRIDPQRDLVPVCPNCYAVIHYGGRLLSPQKVKSFMKAARDKSQQQ